MRILADLWVINGALAIKMFYSSIGNYRGQAKISKWSI